MTREEIEDIVAIMETADGGCPYCARSLVHGLADTFPEWEAVIREAFKYNWEHEE